MVAWYSAADGAEQSRLSGAWPGAPIANAETIGFVLDTAKLQVLTYAPKPVALETQLELILHQHGLTARLGEVLALLDTDATAPPFNYVYAQLQQAKNLWAAGAADENGDIGTEGYSFVPRPLDKTIKSIIRPTGSTIDGL